ncbi:hypothetical protein CEXT_545661 [Caerostris extrusa]|uniref:Uncharacterized protein n=1 Tax=Caerostris extrusa TaxID=172846 RepID=A0AAV4W6H9_CAEEX|nr:hypothetical protein CEXT_545661 [Caerostris extrusa]
MGPIPCSRSEKAEPFTLLDRRQKERCRQYLNESWLMSQSPAISVKSHQQHFATEAILGETLNPPLLSADDISRCGQFLFNFTYEYPRERDELLKYPLNGPILYSRSENAEPFTLHDRRGKRDAGNI